MTIICGALKHLLLLLVLATWWGCFWTWAAKNTGRPWGRRTERNMDRNSLDWETLESDRRRGRKGGIFYWTRRGGVEERQKQKQNKKSRVVAAGAEGSGRIQNKEWGGRGTQKTAGRTGENKGRVRRAQKSEKGGGAEAAGGEKVEAVRRCGGGWKWAGK